MAEPYRILFRLMSRVDAERVHDGALRALQTAGAVAPIGKLARRLWGPAADPVEVFGVRFPNRVGIAAGFDKDGIAWKGLSRLGVGHVEVGTVTLRPQPGNPRPRVFRLPEERAVINRMGFPSRGADHLADRLSVGRIGDTVIGVNIGKGAGTPLDRAEDDYVALLERFAAVADYLCVNISSPNTPGLRSLQTGHRLGPLLSALVGRRNELDPRRALLVKIAPDLEPGELDATLDALLEAGVDGLVATNTTVSRPDPISARGNVEGGLSGAPLASRALAVLERIAGRTGGALPIVASGGVMTPADATARFDAGATLVQLYTGLVYRGPRLLREITSG